MNEQAMKSRARLKCRGFWGTECHRQMGWTTKGGMEIGKCYSMKDWIRMSVNMLDYDQTRCLMMKFKTSHGTCIIYASEQNQVTKI